MTVDEVLEDIRSQMRSAADAEFAAGARRFFQEEVDPWGVRTADLQPIVRRTWSLVRGWSVQDRNKLCEELWRGKFEEGVLVNHVYRRFARSCTRCEFKLFERWLDRRIHNWAHCDGLASWLLAACIANEPALKQELPAWTASRNRWKRRAAAVGLLQEAKKGRSTGDILHIAQLLREDADEMVQKGVGWLLKEAYPKRPAEIVAFLEEVAFPRLVVRYAAEKMSAEHRLVLGFSRRKAVRLD